MLLLLIVKINKWNGKQDKWQGKKVIYRRSKFISSSVVVRIQLLLNEN